MERVLRQLIGVGVMLMLCVQAWAQAYPVKPGRIIVPSAPGVGTASPRQTSVNAASRTVPTRAAAAKGKPMASPKAPGLRSIASSKAMDEFHGRLAGIKHEVDEVNHKLDVFEQKTK